MNFTGTNVIHAIWTDNNLIVPFPKKIILNYYLIVRLFQII